MCVYKTIFVLILTFGSEFWILSKKLKGKVQLIAMKFLARIDSHKCNGKRKNGSRIDTVSDRESTITMVWLLAKHEGR